MLERLVASNASGPDWRRTPSAVLSAVVHGLIIVGAVAATRTVAPPVPPPPDLDTLDVVLAPPERPRDRPEDGGAIWIAPGQLLVERVDLVPFPIHVPDGKAPPESSAGRIGTIVGSAQPGDWSWAQGHGDPTLVVSEALADEPPLLLTRPELEYPAPLRAAGITGRVVIEVIVGADGVPEADSFRVILGDHRGFEAAARRVVLGARFRPGRWRGRPVRVLIRQPVEFRLVSGYREPPTANR
jgi:protein TonB